MIDAAIVGLGRWGRNLVNAVQGQSEKLRFSTGVVRREEPAREFAGSTRIKLMTDFDGVLRDPSIHAVVLATPHSLHVDQIVAAAAAGKHVFCEKPLALTRKEAERAIEACRRAKVVLGLGHDKRFWGSMQALLRTVKSGELGEILHLEGHFSNESTGRYYKGWRSSDDDAPGGALTATGVHILEMFIELVGPVRSIDAHVVSHPPSPAPVDSMSLFLEFESGPSGVLSAVRTTAQFYRVRAFGKGGWAEAVESTELNVRKIDAEPEKFTFEKIVGLKPELEAFADAVAGGAPYPITLKQMVDTTAALEMAIAAYSAASK